MGGEFRAIADDGNYRVTIGSTDNPKYPDDSFFVSQQDAGGHMTTIYDYEHRIIDQHVK